MGQTDPDKSASSSAKADLIRYQIIASDAARVAGWVAAMVRAIEARRTHALDDSGLHKIHTDLEAAARSCLDQIGDFTIRVEESGLLFEGHCIYHSATKEGSLSVALFKDGLREIVIRQGLEPDEMRALVDILERVTDGCDQDSEDVVTLLWEGSFRHIDYVCVPVEEWDPEPCTEGEEVESNLAGCGMSWPTEAPAEGEAGSDPGGPVDWRSDDWSLRGDEAVVLSEVLPAQFSLTQIEADNICMLANIEYALSPRDRILEILSAALAAEERQAEFLEIASSLGRLVELAFAQGDMERANHLVDQLRSISNSKTTTPGEFQSATNQILQHIARSDVLGRLGTILSRRRDIDLGALTKFLAQLGPSAAPTLCGILGEIEEMKIRRVICEALAISCKNHVGILIERLSDPRWFVVRNILYILGRIAHQGVERALGDALCHPDVRVRTEAVRVLGGIESPTSRAYLNSALRDSDKSIRILVAQLLARRTDERASRIIWSVIESPEFVGRDADERRAFFEALGRTSSDDLIPKMERMLTGGGLSPSGRDGRMEAAMALAWLGTPAALDVLRREERSKHDAVRRAVTDALETVMRSVAKNPPKG